MTDLSVSDADPRADESPFATVDLTRTPLAGDPFNPSGYDPSALRVDLYGDPVDRNPYFPDPNDPTLDGGQVLHHMAFGARPEDFHPALQPLARGYSIAFQPQPPMGPGLLGSLDDIMAATAATPDAQPTEPDAQSGDDGYGPIVDAPILPQPLDLDTALQDVTYKAVPESDDVQDSGSNNEDVADAAAGQPQRGFVNPWGRIVPVRSNVSDFVNKNWSAAERLAAQIPGLTPEQILSALGSENKYGDDWKAKQEGNYGGIHFDPSRGKAGYFPGQIGVFNTQGALDPRSGKIVGVQPMVGFPPDKGFELSGQVLVNRIKPFVPSEGITDPKQFFQLIQEHGHWGNGNPTYMDDVYGRYGSYWLVKAAAEARKANENAHSPK